jgi:hypothetical protein
MNSREQSEAVLNDLLANKELLEMGIKPIAGLYWARHVALMDAGFSEQQAFTIVLNRGLE